eukprot:EG_transcript_13398
MTSRLRRLVGLVVLLGLGSSGGYLYWATGQMSEASEQDQPSLNVTAGTSAPYAIPEFSFLPGDERCAFHLSWCTRHYADFFTVTDGPALVWRRNNCTYHPFTAEEFKKRVRSLRLASAGDSVSRDIAYYMLALMEIDTKMPKKAHQNWHVSSGGFSFHNWWLYHLAVQLFNLKAVLRESPDIFIFNTGVWETTWFWSPQHFPYPPGLHFTTEDRKARVEQFLQNYNDTVAKFAREIARHTARRVWHAGDRCYKVGRPTFIYRTTLRLNCNGSLWVSKMSIAPCSETQALLDRMNAILIPAFQAAGALVLVTDKLFATPASCPRGDGVHPDKACHRKLYALLVNVIAAAMRQNRKCVCHAPPARLLPRTAPG